MSCRNPPSQDGLLLLDKPPGITSFTALGAIKKKLGTKKAGHTGTLDKFASGLLVVLTGRYTRLAPFITDMDKTYECVFEFGIQTTTLDPEGEVICARPAPEKKVLLAAASRFTGPLMQRPPDFSAIHVNGKRASQRARAGEKPVLKERPVTIYSFDVQEYSPPFLSCRVSCGKGTYIRSLARDLAEACGSCAYVKELKRMEVGPFFLKDAVSPEDFIPEKNLLAGRAVLEKLIPCPSLVVKESCLASLMAGKPLRDDFFHETSERGEPAEAPPQEEGRGRPCLVFTESGDLAALIERRASFYAYRFVCGQPE
jgi:tRNA pseudouridine55 synthase